MPNESKPQIWAVLEQSYRDPVTGLEFAFVVRDGVPALKVTTQWGRRIELWFDSDGRVLGPVHTGTAS